MRKFARDNAPVEPWDVKTNDILDWFADQQWSRETVRLRRSAVRAFYRWARLTKRTKKNPAKDLPIVPMQRSVPRPAEEDDVRRTIRTAGERERLAIELAAGLGLRCGEIALLHSSDLRERDGQWWLRVQGKGARERMLPVPESIATALRSRGSGYVLPGQISGHISPQYLSKLVNAALPAGVTMHQLRHRFATVAYEKTHDTFVVQKLLGHASPATTQGYVALTDLSLRSAVEAVAINSSIYSS
ncbi:MAG: tyrosine-type recombinase/integrase [Microbacterium sp.]|nr:tyrosine-type recombinase/integrase [Microbacterium sp.]